MFWRTLSFGSIARVPVRMHSTCLLYPGGFLAWLVWTNPPSAVRDDEILARAAVALLLPCVVWASLLAHEFGHVFAARWCGVGTRSVLFIPLGAVALLDAPLRNTRELWIAAAGPAVSLGLAGLCWQPLPALLRAVDTAPFMPPLSFAVAFGCVINLMIALFNLVPCFPMDGGRILRSLLATGLGARVSRQRAFDCATTIVVRCVNPLVVLGVLIFTIAVSHEWLHLVLFPLLLVAGECELRAQRDTLADPESHRPRAGGGPSR